MSLCKHHFVVLLSLVSLFVAGTLIFTSGFLLNRAVVNLTSECHADFILQSERHGEEGCWMHKRFSRAVIVVIDALRYDFMLTNLSSTRENEFFHNKLPVFEELLQRKPLNSRLYKFLADPPTTTLQRLKGLTTGSLPTFVDAGSNFGSDEIKEDNLIHQLYSLEKPIVFLGDDTWDGLFPDKFLRSAFFPSFNVMDLHTVDNGILEHLDPELKKTDWDVLIMHFLGVDHCGHRFGPYNPEMAKKLHQMDKMLRSVIQDLRGDTVLMVLGDHGMTRTGDHGGDSDSELEAGLFIYSPAQITATPLPSDPTHYKTVSQIDLVPTLALLLGIPVPFSNLGMVMTDLFNHCPWSKTQNSKIKQIFHSLKALRLNAYQVHAYLEAYRKISDDFPKEKLDHLQALFRHSESDLQHLLTSMVNNDESNAERNMEILQGHYVTYISEVKELCQKMWAKFNMPSIHLGLLLILFALTLTFLVLLGTQKKKDLYWLSFGCIGSCVLLAGIGVLQHFVAFELPQLSMTVVLGFFDVLVFVLVAFGIWRVSKQQKNTGKKENEPESKTKSLPDIDVGIAILLCMVSFAGYFSNSYVVYEDAVVTFSAQTVILVLGYRVIKDILCSEFMSDLAEREKTGRQKRTSRFDVMKLLTHPASIAAAVVAVLLICVRFSSIFRACREEQINCEISTLFIPLSESPVKNIRYFTGIGCLAAYVTAARLWLRHFGNLNGQSLPVLCARYALPLAAIFIGMHWAVLSLPAEILDGLPTWQSTVLPQLVYILLLICVAAVIFSPLCIFMLPVDSKEELTVQPGLTHLQMIPSLFNRVKLNWGKQIGNGGSPPKPPVVYGLGTVYSASVVFLLSVLSLLASLLLADGISPVIFILLLSQCLYLELSSTFLRSQSTAFLSGHLLPVLGWLILSSVFFYNSGHQATITTIRWEAAFIGFRGHHTTNILPAMLIGMNIFCSQVLFLVASPLLLFSQKVSLKLFNIFSKTKSEGAMSEDKGEFSLHEEPDSLRTGMFKLCLLIFFLQGLKLFGSMCAAALHRRHLMVWKIFAPRFVYEGVVSFIVFGACCLMYLFVLRVDAVLAQWVQKLTNQSESRKGV